MNTLKRTLALMLCVLLTITCLAGCHQKGEIAVKIGEIEFTSGYYACALVFADSEARNLVQEQLSEEGDVPEDIKYWDYKVEDTDYVKWVEDRAISMLKELAAVKTLCNQANVQLDEETKSLSKTNSEYLWDSYGYSMLMEQNGVSEATFNEYMLDSYLADEYFDHLYGEGGEKAIASEKVAEQLNTNYVLVNKLEASFSDLNEEDITDKRNQFVAYEESLKNGSQTFEQIYMAYNEISEEDHTHEEAEEGELAPQDYHATVLGAEETSYASDQFKTAKDMAVGEVKLVTLDDDAGLVLLVKKDIAADPYYLDQLDTTLRQEIIGDDYTDDLEEYGNKLEFVVNESSVKQFKVKKIKYPE